MQLVITENRNKQKCLNFIINCVEENNFKGRYLEIHNLKQHYSKI